MGAPPFCLSRACPPQCKMSKGFAAAPHEELMELARATLGLLAGIEVAQVGGGFSEESENDDHLLCGLCPKRETRSKSRAFWAS